MIPLGLARLRPSVPVRTTLPPLSALQLTQSRFASNNNVPTEEPKKRAQSIIDALPGNSLVSKTAILSAGAGLSIAAISNELYVMNEETVVAFCLLTVFYGIFKYGSPMYNDWAKGQIEKHKDILGQARTKHTDAVKSRIENVKQLDGVVDITKALFEVSKVQSSFPTSALLLPLSRPFRQPQPTNTPPHH